MKAPQYREYIHHVATERGVSHYHIRKGMGKDAEVIASVVVQSAPFRVHCVTCSRDECDHAKRVRERALGGK